MIEALRLTLNAIKANKLRSFLILLAVIFIVAAAIVAFSRFEEGFNAEQVAALIEEYGYYIIFVLVLVGNIGVPVPEETIVLASGFAAQRGLLDYKVVLIVSVFSAILGDNIGYLIGRKGGRKLILSYGRYVWINEERLKKFEQFFERYGDKTVFFARFIAGLRFLNGPLSGAAQMPFRRFFAFNSMGALAWVFVMTQIGYHFGRQLPHVLRILGQANLIILVLIVAVLVTLWYLRKRRRQTD